MSIGFLNMIQEKLRENQRICDIKKCQGLKVQLNLEVFINLTHDLNQHKFIYRRRIISQYHNSFIMDEEMEKQMSSTNKKEKIFNVRKLHYKQYDPHDKYLKPQFSPFQVKDNIYQPPSQKATKKTTEYNYHLAIISSTPYKELNKRYCQLKEQQAKEKEKKLKELKQKQDQLLKFEAERQRLAIQRQRLSKRRDELKAKIGQIQNRNQELRTEQMRRSTQFLNEDEQYRILNMQYLRNMLMSMRYQNGVDIDIDNMSYEELLQLQQKMGTVSKGLNQEQYSKLHKSIAHQKKQGEERLCSICYDEVKCGDQVITLPCHHKFHSDCIKEWLIKEKVCPLCKQEIVLHNS